MEKYVTKVLLVEDEKVARDTLSFYLNTIFDEVTIASNGAEGLNTFKEQLSKNKYFDLILTDLKMPHKSGMSMIDGILKIMPEQRFIIVSAHKNQEDLLKLINLHVLGYFTKPLNIDNMMQILQKVKKEVLSSKLDNILDKDLIKLNEIYTYHKIKNKLYNLNLNVKLSKKELDILKVLINNMGELVPVEQFKKDVWGDVQTNDSAFRTVMKRLKDKVKDNDFIISHKGYGYIVEMPL